MTLTDAAAAPAGPQLRCSTWTREQGVDPIGTAGTYDGYLLVGWPLPWPADLADEPALAPVAAAARAAKVRLQGAVPVRGADRSSGAAPEEPGVIRLAMYHRALGSSSPGAPVGAHRRLGLLERFVTKSELAEAAVELVSSALAGGPAVAGPASDEVPAASELLICTHGRRDRCCGALGTSLSVALSADPDLLGPSVRITRTSHTGGHRFAPTAILLPEGTSWAYLDVPTTQQIVARTGRPAEVVAHYRGCALLGSPEVQAIERAVLAAGEELDGPGWSLLDLSRWGQSGPDGTTELHVERSTGRIDRFSGRVSVGRRIPVPDCGLGIEHSHKDEGELEVTELRRLERTD